MTHLLALIESNTTGTGRLFAAAARDRGARPVLFASAPDRYPWAAADGVEVRRVDTDVQDALLGAVRAAAGRAGDVGGVLSSSEYFVEAAARLAARLGLPAASPAAVARCRDKRVQRATLRSAGVPVPRFAVAATTPAAVRVADDLGYPVVVKPVDGSGSRGVRLCGHASEVADHVDGLLATAHDERGRRSVASVLVEEHVGGPEVSVETFGLHPVAVVDKHLGPPPVFVEYGHDMPSTRPPGLQDAAIEAATSALSALGLDWGAAHTEVRLAPAGPVVIEVNPRLAGGHIPELVRLATGLDLIDATVAAALGQAPAPRAACPAKAASIRFLVAEQSVRVQCIDGVTEAAAVPGVVDVAVTAPRRTAVGGTGSFLDRIGWVIAAGTTWTGAAGAATEALARLRVVPAETDHQPPEEICGILDYDDGASAQPSGVGAGLS